MNNLSDITKKVAEIEAALKGMNFGRGLKLAEGLREELEEMHLEFFYYPEAAINHYESAVEATIRKEIGKTLSEKFDEEVERRVSDRIEDERLKQTSG